MTIMTDMTRQKVSQRLVVRGHDVTCAGRGEWVGVDRHGQLPGQLVQILGGSAHRGMAQ